MATMDKQKPEWLNKTNMAASLGISTQAFTQWKVEPIARIGRESFYDVASVLANRVEHYRHSTPGGSDAETRKVELEEAKIRLTNEQADALELKNQTARHEVAPFTFFTFVLGRIANEIAGVMDSLPLEMMRKLSLQPKDVEKVKVITALASESICNLGDEEFIENALDEFIDKAEA